MTDEERLDADFTTPDEAVKRTLAVMRSNIEGSRALIAELRDEIRTHEAIIAQAELAESALVALLAEKVFADPFDRAGPALGAPADQKLLEAVVHPIEAIRPPAVEQSIPEARVGSGEAPLLDDPSPEPPAAFKPPEGFEPWGCESAELEPTPEMIEDAIGADFADEADQRPRSERLLDQDVSRIVVDLPALFAAYPQGASPVHIAERTGVSQNRVYAALKALAKSGLIQYVPRPHTSQRLVLAPGVTLELKRPDLSPAQEAMFEVLAGCMLPGADGLVNGMWRTDVGRSSVKKGSVPYLLEELQRKGWIERSDKAGVIFYRIAKAHRDDADAIVREAAKRRLGERRRAVTPAPKLPAQKPPKLYRAVTPLAPRAKPRPSSDPMARAVAEALTPRLRPEPGRAVMEERGRLSRDALPCEMDDRDLAVAVRPPTTCQWPTNTPHPNDMYLLSFCGDPVESDGAPYCSVHMDKAYQRHKARS